MAWWLDPLRALAFIILPIFCYAAYLNQFTYWTYNASEDFVTSQTFGLGLFSAGLFMTGVLLARIFPRRRGVAVIFDENRAVQVLRWLGWTSILAYILFLGTLVVHPGLVLSLFRGDVEAGSELRDALGEIPGVTSLVQFGLLYLALLSAMITLGGYRPPPRMRLMTTVILLLIFLRAVLNSERLAFLEAMAASFVTPIAYRWKPSAWRAVAPVLGILFIFLIFAGAEYFRSWQFYQAYYTSYADFIFPRFAGYFSTSINNGAGAYLTYGQVSPQAEHTVGWVTKFPVLGKMIFGESVDTYYHFLNDYATVEFNNPGGFYEAFLDYPFWIASIFMIIVGMLVGFLYRSFQNISIFGLLLYPFAFQGTTDLIRGIYIVNTRTFPLFLGAFAAIYALKPRNVSNIGSGFPSESSKER